jgi:hypothetical protein
VTLLTHVGSILTRGPSRALTGFFIRHACTSFPIVHKAGTTRCVWLCAQYSRVHTAERILCIGTRGTGCCYDVHCMLLFAAELLLRLRDGAEGLLLL